MRAYFSSLSSASGKPMEKVFTGRVESVAMSATTVDESTPPDRKAPSGTSATMRRRTASRRSLAELLRELLLGAPQRRGARRSFQ
jgi:hypothetical protein